MEPSLAPAFAQNRHIDICSWQASDFNPLPVKASVATVGQLKDTTSNGVIRTLRALPSVVANSASRKDSISRKVLLISRAIESEQDNISRLPGQILIVNWVSQDASVQIARVQFTSSRYTRKGKSK